MRTSFPIRVTTACLLVTMTACTTWQPHPHELDPDRELPRRMRVNLATGESVKLVSPHVEGDTALVGKRYREFRRVPLRDVVSLEVGQVSAGRTVLLGVVGAVVLVGATALAIAASDICWYCGSTTTGG